MHKVVHLLAEAQCTQKCKRFQILCCKWVKTGGNIRIHSLESESNTYLNIHEFIFFHDSNALVVQQLQIKNDCLVRGNTLLQVQWHSLSDRYLKASSLLCSYHSMNKCKGYFDILTCNDNI